jgi:hypothetical protein
MIRPFIPRFSQMRWGGSTDDGERAVGGFSLSIEWLGLFVEIALGKVRF